MSAENLLARLDHVRATDQGQWIARCPAHDDRGPSLAIREAGDGRTLIHCFAGCPAAAVMAAVGLELRDLFPDRDHDDAGRPAGWRSTGRKDAKQQRVFLSPRTALIALAADAVLCAVLAADLAEQKIEATEARGELFELAGRIAGALQITGVLRHGNN